METSANQNDPFYIIIPISGIHEIHLYQRSILNILGRVNLDNVDPESIEYLKVAYSLLDHLNTNERRLSKLM